MGHHSEDSEMESLNVCPEGAAGLLVCFIGETTSALMILLKERCLGRRHGVAEKGTHNKIWCPYGQCAMQRSEGTPTV